MILFLAGTGCSGIHPEARAAATQYQPAPETLVRQVADRVLTDFPEPPPFDWGEGVLMAGMMHAGIALDEPRYIDFVRQWADHWNAVGLDKILPGGPTPDFPAYCGYWGPGYPVLMLYERTGDRKYLDMARGIADFIMTRATRTSEGGVGHWGGNKQLWVDTLYMMAPLYAGLARVTGDPKYTEEAVDQMLLYARRAQDPETGLFYHMYDEPSGKIVGVLWGRGNGWVAMSYVELFEELRYRSMRFEPVREDFDAQVKGILATQDPKSHLWHTVMDHPETYLETSASAMILSAFIRAQAMELLDLPDKFYINTWKALAEQVDDQGHVINVSGGTIPEKMDVYADKIVGTYTWGTGAFLMAAGGLHQYQP